ncbi:unnamed protein product [Closterium sp. NIES-54]
MTNEVEVLRRELSQQQQRAAVVLEQAVMDKQPVRDNQMVWQQQRAAVVLEQAVMDKQIEMQRELNALLRALASKEERMRRDVEGLHDRVEDKEMEIERLKRVIGRLEGDKREQEEMIAVGRQQVDTHKRVIEMLVEKGQTMQQQMVAMEKRALTAEGMARAFLEISGAEKGYTTFGSAVGLESSYLPSGADLDALSHSPLPSPTSLVASSLSSVASSSSTEQLSSAVTVEGKVNTLQASSSGEGRGSSRPAVPNTMATPTA